ncbi:hypothetical protein F8M41_024546 [Gigaspora margarita]|uniref:Uncharacterized protein n=1 Tax=Gigaspora margarita TaxID=4874 RepID=A0A8H3XKT6_GIGMA|nr:hypothetical protein F8M41_024546 [Gigaspora margarita]
MSYLRDTQYRCPICEIELTEQEVDNYSLFWDNSIFKIDVENFSQAHAEFSSPNDAESDFHNNVELNEFQDDSIHSILESYEIHANTRGHQKIKIKLDKLSNCVTKISSYYNGLIIDRVMAWRLIEIDEKANGNAKTMIQ